MGEATLGEVKAEVLRRIKQGEFIERTTNAPGKAFTTREMIGYERDTIDAMRAGQKQHMPIVRLETRHEIEREHSHLNQGQRQAIEQILSNHDQVVALEGVAGAGKTTALAAIRKAAECDGYEVKGFAPTSRAAQKLAEAGIESSTLQRHFAAEKPKDGQKRLYVLDESSLASTKQMNQFLHGLHQGDRMTAPD